VDLVVVVVVVLAGEELEVAISFQAVEGLIEVEDELVVVVVEDHQVVSVEGEWVVVSPQVAAEEEVVNRWILVGFSCIFVEKTKIFLRFG
jgi:hypothetical protein